MKQAKYVRFMMRILCSIIVVPLGIESANNKDSMKITSSAFQDHGNIPSQYTCDGANINPPLTIAGVPEKAQSLVLIVDDPDAPKGTWVHWVVWNIPPSTTEITENSVPGIQGMTNFGKNEYGGPCPPSGTHRYFFKLYALDKKLNLGSKATKKDVERGMKQHVIGQAELVGLYKHS